MLLRFSPNALILVKEKTVPFGIRSSQFKMWAIRGGYEVGVQLYEIMPSRELGSMSISAWLGTKDVSLTDTEQLPQTCFICLILAMVLSMSPLRISGLLAEKSPWARASTDGDCGSIKRKRRDALSLSFFTKTPEWYTTIASNEVPKSQISFALPTRSAKGGNWLRSFRNMSARCPVSTFSEELQ